MKSDDGANRLTESDPYATRPPSAETLEALAIVRDPASEESTRNRGVGREDFDRGLLECGFLDAEGLRGNLAELAKLGRPDDSETLARHLVQVGVLTRYQASAIYQGKGRSLLIGPYVVLDKLGSGGMGMVFKARARKGGPEVALKLLPPSASKHPKAVLRFRREAEIMEKLNHPNVVASHEIGHYNGVHYLVMDYVEGRDLDRIVRSSGPLKLSRAIDCIIQAGKGLAVAHERGIVHRDIKPANLLLDTKGIVRVLDLGLARITQGDDSVKDAISAPSLTASGIIMGTVDFLPPEQSDDSKRADHRADIYALGCTLYYLLTGKPPYAGESIMQRLLAHHQKPIPSLKDARPEVPFEIDHLFKKMMAKSPDDRPQSINAVIEPLEAWRNQAGGGKSLRVFNDGGTAAKSVLATKPEEIVRQPPEETEAYDLLTFVRDELLAPDSGPLRTDPSPVLARKSKKSRKRAGWGDLALRGLVAAAAITVLIRFLPVNLFPSKPAVTPPVPAPTAVVEPPPKVEPPAVVKPNNPETATPKLITTPKADADKPPRLTESTDPGPPSGPSRLEELIRPPPPVGPPGSFPTPPRNGATPQKKGQAPPRGPGSP